MKKIIYTIIFLAVLSGCAKVTQESLPCNGSIPAAPIISDMVVSVGSYGTFTIQNYTSGSRVVVTGPNNYTATIITQQFTLPVNSSSDYGKYTAICYINGCVSNSGTFHILSSFTGAPSCTISPSNYNVLNMVPPSGITVQFSFYSATQYGANSFCYANVDISGTSISGVSVLDFNTPATPPAGTYCQLVPNCSSAGNSQAYVTISNGGTIAYESVSGKAYCNLIGGQTYLTFCGATFSRIPDGALCSLTGNLLWQ